MEHWELKNQIKVQRAIRNITQDELAAQINTIETGKFTPSTILAIRLSRFFGLGVEQLFELTEK